MDLKQIQEIRKGILLAKNDYRATSFRVKHECDEDGLVDDWMEAYQIAEDALIGGRPISALTELAYGRTIKGLLRNLRSTTSN
jgi:hypothetical protein